MNLFPIFLLVITLLYGVPCVGGEPSSVATARSMVEAINERDLDGLNHIIAEDMFRHSAATAGITSTSLSDFKTFLRSDFAAVPDSVISIDVIFGNDKFVAMRAIYSGTQTGQMGPFPPSWKRVDLPFIGILRFADDMIAEMWVEWDNVHMLSQLGHLQPSSDPPE